MAKRKRSTIADASPAATDASNIDISKIRHTEVPLPPNVKKTAPTATRRQSARGGAAATTNPNINPDVLDGKMALRASPDGHESGEPSSHLKSVTGNGTANNVSAITNGTADMAPSTQLIGVGANGAGAAPTAKGKRKKAPAQNVKVEDEEANIGAVNGAVNITGSTENNGMAGDPEDADGLEEDEVEVKEALSRPPPVNSEYLPLPWKGRLGYVRYRTATMQAQLTSALGMSQHISPQRQSSRVQLPHMSHRQHPRASPSPEGPLSARTCHEKSPRQGTTRRCGARDALCRRIGPR
jgi:UV DNA damage endonuclease